MGAIQADATRDGVWHDLSLPMEIECREPLRKTQRTLQA